MSTESTNAAKQALQDAYNESNEHWFDVYTRAARLLDSSITSEQVDALKFAWMEKVMRAMSKERGTA